MAQMRVTVMHLINKDAPLYESNVLLYEFKKRILICQKCEQEKPEN